MQEKKENKAKKNSTREKVPVGMILILIYLGFSILGGIQSLFNPSIQFGPLIITGAIALLPAIISLTIISLIFYGILKRKIFSQKLAIYWFLYTIIIGIINLISFIINPTIYDFIMQEALGQESSLPEIRAVMMFVVGIGALISMGLSILIIIYLKKRKDYFTN
jgi:hypothetical protein